MSTKTTFKRIALVAVAALGLGVMSVAPSQAAVSAVAITGVTDGTSTNSADGYTSDSTTAGTFTVSGLTDAGYETITVTLVAKSAKAAAATNAFLYYVDSATSGLTLVESHTSILTASNSAGKARPVASATDTGTGVVPSAGFRLTRTTAGYIGAKFAIQLDSYSARAAGTYTWTIIAKGYSDAAGNATSTTADVSVVVAAADSSSTTVDPSKTTAYINTGSATNTSADSAVAVLATASTTDHATIAVRTYNASSAAAAESVTATITGAGVLCNGGVCGKSLSLTGATGSTDITVRADGTAGTGSIVIKTTTVTFGAKLVTFFAANASTFATPSVARPVIGVATVSDVVRVTATDASGSKWAGTAYIVASSAADALIAGSETPVACTFDAADDRHECPVTGKAVGTAKFKIIDASTVAAAKATSAEVSVRVSASTAASFTMAWDKSTYAPGEKAILRVTPLDSAGLTLPTVTITNLYATGAITSNLVLTAVSTTASTNSVSPTVQAANSSSDPNNLATAGAITYIYQLPQTTGTVTVSAKGGTGLPAAGQVTVTASAEVVNSSVDAATDAANEATDAANAATDAALAAADAADAATAAAQDASDAVAALSASVSKMISNLRAQITSLTNLVIKIQKKVKA